WVLLLRVRRRTVERTMAAARLFPFQKGEPIPLILGQGDKSKHLGLRKGEDTHVDFSTTQTPRTTPWPVSEIWKVPDRKAALAYELRRAIFRQTGGGEHFVPEDNQWEVLQHDLGLLPALDH